MEHLEHSFVSTTDRAETSLGVLLKHEIESYCKSVEETCPLFLEAKQGRVTPAHLAHFVDGVFYLIQHTQILLRIARRECAKKGLWELGEFYKLKIEEEKGHEQWALEDLDRLEKRFHVDSPFMVSDPMFELVEEIRNSILRDPVLYLSYIILAEYATVLITPQWGNDLSVHCGIPRDSISVLGNHVELDKAHVTEMVEMIDRFADKEKYEMIFLTQTRRFMELHRRFCTDTWMSAQTWSE